MLLVVRHEGRRARVYVDSLGHPTVGVGFNLDRPDARARLSLVGADYSKVRTGTATLSDEQIDALFRDDFGASVAAAQALCPTWDDQPAGAQAVLVDMAFNMGRGGLSAFKRMLGALTLGNHAGATYEMLDSRWSQEVPSRAIEDAMLMLRGERAA